MKKPILIVTTFTLVILFAFQLTNKLANKSPFSQQNLQGLRIKLISLAIKEYYDDCNRLPGHMHQLTQPSDCYKNVASLKQSHIKDRFNKELYFNKVSNSELDISFFNNSTFFKSTEKLNPKSEILKVLIKEGIISFRLAKQSL